MRWTGPDGRGFQIAIVGAGELAAASGGSGGGSSRSQKTRVLEAVPADAFKKGLKREQFEDLLARRGLSIPDFVELVRREAQRGGPATVRRVIGELEARKPAPASPHRDTSAPGLTNASTRPASAGNATRPAATRTREPRPGAKPKVERSTN